MPISGANYPVVILLVELNLSCKLVLRAAERLRAAGDHWQKLSRGEDDGKTAPPIDIVGDSTIVLNAAATISRMLFLGRRQGKRAAVIGKRCAVLMNLLGNPTLTALGELSVRNSWEHLDERLDAALASGTYSSDSMIHVVPKTPPPSTFVHRRFHPTGLTIGHGIDSTGLRPLVDECTLLVDRIQQAFKRLESERHDPY